MKSDVVLRAGTSHNRVLFRNDKLVFKAGMIGDSMFGIGFPATVQLLSDGIEKASNVICRVRVDSSSIS